MKCLRLDSYDCSWLARRSTGNHKETRELWRETIPESVFVGKADFRNSISCSDCGMRVRDCDADHVTLRLHHHNPQLWHCYTVLHSAIPNCDTLSGQITSRRSLWMFRPMWRFWLTRCITFSSRKVKIREQVKGFFIFPEVDLVLSGAISYQSIDVTSN